MKKTELMIVWKIRKIDLFQKKVYASNYKNLLYNGVIRKPISSFHKDEFTKSLFLLFFYFKEWDFRDEVFIQLF